MERRTDKGAVIPMHQPAYAGNTIWHFFRILLFEREADKNTLSNKPDYFDQVLIKHAIVTIHYKAMFTNKQKKR